MTKFARFNIIWQRGAFLTAAVLDAEHGTYIYDTFAIREGEHPGVYFLFFFFFLFYFFFFQNILEINASFVFPKMP